MLKLIVKLPTQNFHTAVARGSMSGLLQGVGAECNATWWCHTCPEEEDVAEWCYSHWNLHGRSIMVTCEIINVHTYLTYPVHSFLDLVRYLFTIPGVRPFLSERISQDPLEKFIGCQRQRGRVHENPTVADFITNTQALRVVNTLAREMLQKAIAEAAREVTTHVILIYKLMNHYQNVKGQAEL